MPKPKVDLEKCTGCGTCVEVCPVKVFVIAEEKAIVKKPEDCIGCRACESQCPEDAIEVKD